MLSDAERAAGRHFKAQCQQALATLMGAAPPTHRTLPLLGVFRHACAQRGISTAIALKENYQPSPAYQVHPDATVEEPHDPHDRPTGGVPVQAGRFAFIFKEGRCSHCRATVRTEGRLVDGWQRPPLRARRD